MLKLYYFIARRVPGKPTGDSSTALSWHRSPERANRVARQINKINSTGSDVQVYASSKWRGK